MCLLVHSGCQITISKYWNSSGVLHHPQLSLLGIRCVCRLPVCVKFVIGQAVIRMLCTAVGDCRKGAWDDVPNQGDNPILKCSINFSNQSGGEN